MVNFQYSLWCVVKHWLGYCRYKISKVPADWELILSTIMWLYTHRGMTDTVSLLHCIVASSYDLHACRKESKKKKTIKSRPSSFLLRSARTNLMESLFLSLQLNRIEENYSPSSSNEQRKPELSREICKHTKFQSCSRCYHWAISMWLSVNQW